MYDEKISLPRLNTLHPLMRQEAIDIFEEIEKNGVIIRCTQATRTFAEQDAIYQQGRTTPGKIVTWAKAGTSYHNYSLGIDFCLLHKDKVVSWSLNEDIDNDHVSDFMEVITTFEKHGWESGYRWPVEKRDTDHVQKTFGFSIQQLLEMYNKKEYDSNGYLNLVISPRGFGGSN